MAALTAALAAAGLGAAIYGGARAVQANQENARAQRDAQSELIGAQNKAIQDAKTKTAADQLAAENKSAGDAIRKKQRQAGPIYGGTILTSPLGDVAPAQTAGKTLLGS